jgi:hypothetical protein
LERSCVNGPNSRGDVNFGRVQNTPPYLIARELGFSVSEVKERIEEAESLTDPWDHSNANAPKRL